MNAVLQALELIRQSVNASGREQVLICDIDNAIAQIEGDIHANEETMADIRSMDAGQS